MGFDYTGSNLINVPSAGVPDLSIIDVDTDNRVDLSAGGLNIDLSGLVGFLHVSGGAGQALSASSTRNNLGLGVGDSPTFAGMTLTGYLVSDMWRSRNDNTFIGVSVAGAGNLDVGVGYNTFVGYEAGYSVTSGPSNTGIGANALGGVQAGKRNVAVGDNSLFNLQSGDENVAVGRDAGSYIVSNSGSVFLGNQAGYYETSGDRLYIDNTQRTNLADGRVKSLVYGVFDTATANQSFRVNGYFIALEALMCLERSSDPAQPAEGECVIWMSDGTGKGDDGDVLIASTADGVTNYGTLFDHSGGTSW